VTLNVTQLVLYAPQIACAGVSMSFPAVEHTGISPAVGTVLLSRPECDNAGRFKQLHLETFACCAALYCTVTPP
jgi:hypothetical protein